MNGSADLPSRFQLRECVRANGQRGHVVGVTFGLIDGLGKVMYDVVTPSGLLSRLFSEQVTPAEPAHLMLVRPQTLEAI